MRSRLCATRFSLELVSVTLSSGPFMDQIAKTRHRTCTDKVRSLMPHKKILCTLCFLPRHVGHKLTCAEHSPQNT